MQIILVLVGKRTVFTSHKDFENAVHDSISPKHYARLTEMQFEKRNGGKDKTIFQKRQNSLHFLCGTWSS